MSFFQLLGPSRRPVNSQTSQPSARTNCEAHLLEAPLPDGLPVLSPNRCSHHVSSWSCLSKLSLDHDLAQGKMTTNLPRLYFPAARQSSCADGRRGRIPGVDPATVFARADPKHAHAAHWATTATTWDVLKLRSFNNNPSSVRNGPKLRRSVARKALCEAWLGDRLEGCMSLDNGGAGSWVFWTSHPQVPPGRLPNLGAPGALRNRSSSSWLSGRRGLYEVHCRAWSRLTDSALPGKEAAQLA